MSILERRKAKVSTLVLTAPIAALAISGLAVATSQGSPIGSTDLLVDEGGTTASPDGLGGSILSIADISSTGAGLIQTFNVTNLTGNNNASNSATLYTNNNGSNGQLALSDNGTEVTFGGYQGSSSNELAQNVHQAAYLTADGTFGTGQTYNENSNGAGSGQVRSAYSADGTNYVFSDKNGVYTGGATGANNSTNVRYLAGYGGTLFALAQGSNSTNSFFTVNSSGSTLTPITVPGGNFANGTDFDFLQSGDNGTAYDTLYVADGADILKYDYTGGALTAEGEVTGISPKVTDLVAAENGNGAVNIYYTEGNATVEEITDSAAWDSPIAASSPTLLYTAPSGTDLFGISTAPVTVPEPASVSLLGLAGLGLLKRRRSQTK